jgi:eukaryotic-like serine/threonine-protein kinase
VGTGTGSRDLSPYNPPMALDPGSRLGPYEIVGALGAGGMGEVYRAKDTRLGRDVAVKILPAHLSENSEVRERFEREARAISSMNHPHICTLYDIGREGAADYFVMELLDGETLAARLERGPMKLDEALKVGAQIADALAAAHKQGIIHRDLKPGNVALTKSGAKVLDFGVAKLRDEGVVENVTRTTPLTSHGAMVGTVQYMSPEQLEGKPVDHRADLFAFGALFYEMLTGQRAFAGQSQASVIAAILTSEPRPVSQLIPATPAALDRVVTSCLAKDPEERWQSAGDLARELRWIGGATGTLAAAPVAGTAAAGSRRKVPAWLTGALVLAGAATMAALGWTFHRPAAMPLIRVNIVLPVGTSLDSDNASIALSPDGTKLVYAASIETGTSKLWLRPLNGLTAQPLAGTDGASYPVWSPDGSSLLFFADGKLKKVRASGGTAQSICPAPNGRGAAWSPDDVIVFAPEAFGPLFQVPASGGTPVAVTTVPDPTTSATPPTSHRNPHFLPGGKKVLFFSGKSTPGPESGAYVVDLASKRTQLVMNVDSEAIYAAPGYLVFVRENNLLAQPFDASSLKLSGDAVPIAEKVQFNGFRRTGTYTLSGTGMLLYLSDTILKDSQLTLYDLDGKILGAVGDPAMFWFSVHVSPDDRRAVATIRRVDEGSDVWMIDLARGIKSKFTFDTVGGYGAIWSRDGRQVAYADAGGNVWVKAADGSTPSRKITAEPLAVVTPNQWLPDGSGVAAFIRSPGTDGSIVVLPVNGNAKPKTLISAAGNDAEVAFSADGRGMAYGSDESGRKECYVTSYPNPGGKWQVSMGGIGGGGGCGWLGDGKQIWYVDLEGKAFAVPIAVSGEGFEVGTRRPLFGGQVLPIDLADFTHDGKRILGTARRASTTGPVLTLVTQWTSELQQR